MTPFSRMRPADDDEKTFQRIKIDRFIVETRGNLVSSSFPLILVLLDVYFTLSTILAVS